MMSGRTAMAIVAWLVSTLLVYTLCNHRAEGTIVDDILGLEEYSVFGNVVADISSGMRKELHSPLPEVFTKQVADDQKKPTPWPKVFHAKVRVVRGQKKPIVHSYYDYPNGRMMNIVIPPLPQGHTSLLIEDARRRPDSYSESMKRTIRAFERSGELDGIVDRLDGNLFFPETALWMRLEHSQLATYSKKAPICLIRKFPGNIVPPPDMLSDASYLRQETVEGVLCNVFAKGNASGAHKGNPFVLLYENAGTGFPVKYVFFDKAEMIFEKFEPNGTLENKEWEIPFYCKDQQSLEERLPVSISQ